MLDNYVYRHTLRICDKDFDGTNGYANAPRYVYTYIACLVNVIE
jgi:hypothetical protein